MCIRDRYRAEVPLKFEVEEDGFLLIIEGRADGIIEDASGVTIDEKMCIRDSRGGLGFPGQLRQRL